MSDQYNGPAMAQQILRLQAAQHGMTLRDWFAGQAIQAVFAKNWEMFLDNTFQSPEEVPHEVARDAYAIADAMLAAREVKP